MNLTAIKKVLALLMPDWKKVMAEAKTLEARLKKGEDFLAGHHSETYAFVNKLLKQIHQFTDVGAFTTKLQAAKLYRQWKEVPIDYPALIAIPKDFDFENNDHRRALIKSKSTLVKATLQKANIQFKTFDLPAALDDLAEILIVITDIPADFNFDDEAAVLKLRSKKLKQVQPAIVKLVGRFLNKDLDAMGVGKKLDKVNKVVDIALTDDESETTKAKTNESTLSTDTKATPNLLATVQRKIPQVEKALKGETIAGINISKVTGNTGELLALVEQKIPLIEQEFNALQKDLSPTSIVSHAKAICSHLVAVMEYDAAKESFTVFKKSLQELSLALNLKQPNWEAAINQLQALVNIPEDQMPDKLRGFIAFIKSKAKVLLELVAQLGIHSEAFSPLKKLFQKVRLRGITEDEAITRLASLAQIPENMDWSNTRYLITLLKSRAEVLLDLVSHIEIKGINTKSLTTEGKKWLGKLLDVPKDANLNSTTGILLVILEKIIAFMKESKATKQSWLLEQVEKVQMVVQFIHDNGPYIKLQDTIALHQHVPPNKAPARMINAQGRLPKAQITKHLRMASV